MNSFRLDSISSSATLASFGLALLCSCPSSGGGGRGSTAFEVHSSREAVAVGTPIVHSGDYLAFLALEQSGSASSGDLNGDLDTNDSIATVLNTRTREETLLDVAARGLAWLGTTLFIEVREDEDGRDWDGDTEMTSDEYSLLRWTVGESAPTFLTSLDAEQGTRMLGVGGERLFILEEAPASSGPGTTTMSVIEADAVELPLPVTTTSDAANALHPLLIGAQEGLLLCLLQESLDGDLNADGDSEDSVLALLDATQAAMELHVTGKAIADQDTPIRARRRDTSSVDWLVAFLVDEQGEGLSLNDRDLFTTSWEPRGLPGGRGQRHR